MSKHDVIVIGAGPYGLAATAHLRTVKGLDVKAFGEPMSFWQCNMPGGMFLRSNWTATQIADPNRRLTLEAFQTACGNHLLTPVPLERFIDYGLWYQRQAVPDLDRRKIERIDANGNGFLATTQDGEVLRAKRIVIAAGIGSFAWRPPLYDALPVSLASHSSAHREFRRFSGKRVLVVGGGQSALESAALLFENGAEVEVIARSRKINWLQGFASKTLHHRLGKITSRLLYAPTDVGPAGISQLMARPDLLRRLPRGLQERLRRRSVRPAGARWLVERLKNVTLQLGRQITSVGVIGEKARVRLDDGSERMIDHILLGTGYRVNVAQYEFLSPGLVDSVRRVNGYPWLKEGLESTLPGLHFLGAPAVYSFGPLMQFVSGARYSAQSLLRSVAEGRRSR